VTAAKVGYTAIMIANQHRRRQACWWYRSRSGAESIYYPAVYATCTGRLMSMLGLDAEPLPKRWSSSATTSSANLPQLRQGGLHPQNGFQQELSHDQAEVELPCSAAPRTFHDLPAYSSTRRGSARRLVVSNRILKEQARL